MKYDEKHDMVMSIYGQEVEALEDRINAYLHVRIVDAPRHVIKWEKNRLPSNLRLNSRHAVFKCCSEVFDTIEDEEGNNYMISTTEVESQRLALARDIYNFTLRKKAVDYYYAQMTACATKEQSELPDNLLEVV